MPRSTTQQKDVESDDRELIQEDELSFDPWEGEQEDGAERRRDPLRGPVPRREPLPDEEE